MRILVVDDSDLSRLQVGKVCQSAGHEFDEAANGVQALEHLNRSKYDVLITDMNMPEMNGLELLEEIKNKKIEVVPIVVTTNVIPKMAKEAKRLGAKGWLGKPLDEEKLTKILQKIVGS